MANWCSNMVVFEGKPEAIKQIQQLFLAMKEKQDHTQEGQLPDFADPAHGGYFFDLYWNETDQGIFEYETKWSPNTQILKNIADLYKVNFIHDYQEMGSLIYGRATYQDGILHDISLKEDDFETYAQNQETDLYHFEGKAYESDYEILETLLERKIATL